AHQHEGVLLVNPGAIASPNFATRQLRRTVARLHLAADGTRRVEHVDLDRPGEPFAPSVDWSAGFRVAFDRVSASILEPALAPIWDDLRRELMDALPIEVLRDVFAPVAQRVRGGERVALTCVELRRGG